MSQEVIITGVGAVTAFGAGMESLWEGLCAGASAIGPIGAFDASGFDCQQAAEVPADFSAKQFVPKSYRKAVKVMARDIEYAVAAAQEAARDAGLVTREKSEQEPTYPPGRLGCQIGAGLIACEMPEMAHAMSSAADGKGSVDIRAWGERGMQNLTPLWLLKYLPNMLACHVTIIHGAEGPSNTITCSEASGLLSIGESRSVILRGRADVCFAGSAEAKINAMGMMRMQLAGRLARCAPDEADVVRPFSVDASGSVLGDGGGLVIVERRETAEARGARAYARVTGFGAGHSPAGDSPMQAAEGLGDALEMALDDARLSVGDVDAIVPSAFGTAAQDEGELEAMRRVFGDRLASIPLVLLPRAVGSLCAGVGGVSLAVGAMCVREQRLPARLASDQARQGVCAGAADSCSMKIGTMVICSSSQGGQHAAVVLKRV